MIVRIFSECTLSTSCCPIDFHRVTCAGVVMLQSSPAGMHLWAILQSWNYGQGHVAVSPYCLEYTASNRGLKSHQTGDGMNQEMWI